MWCDEDSGPITHNLPGLRRTMSAKMVHERDISCNRNDWRSVNQQTIVNSTVYNKIYILSKQDSLSYIVSLRISSYVLHQTTNRDSYIFTQFRCKFLFPKSPRRDFTIKHEKSIKYNEQRNPHSYILRKVNCLCSYLFYAKE